MATSPHPSQRQRRNPSLPAPRSGSHRSYHRHIAPSPYTTPPGSGAVFPDPYYSPYNSSSNSSGSTRASWNSGSSQSSYFSTGIAQSTPPTATAAFLPYYTEEPGPLVVEPLEVGSPYIGSFHHSQTWPPDSAPSRSFGSPPQRSGSDGTQLVPHLPQRTTVPPFDRRMGQNTGQHQFTVSQPSVFHESDGSASHRSGSHEANEYRCDHVGCEYTKNGFPKGNDKARLFKKHMRSHKSCAIRCRVDGCEFKIASGREDNLRAHQESSNCPFRRTWPKNQGHQTGQPYRMDLPPQRPGWTPNEISQDHYNHSSPTTISDEEYSRILPAWVEAEYL